jgi:hypothetical protein
MKTIESDLEKKCCDYARKLGVARINAAINKAKATINVIRLGVSATLYEL